MLSNCCYYEGDEAHMLREPLNNFILLPMKCIITKVDTLNLAQHIIACLTQWFSDPVKCKLNAD